MDAPFDLDRLLEKGVETRLAELLEDARRQLPAQALLIFELAAVDGRLLPRCRAPGVHPWDDLQLSLDGFFALVGDGQTRVLDASALGVTQATGAATLVPLTLSPRLSHRGPDALLVAIHEQAGAPEASKLASLRACLEIGLSEERRTRLTEVLFQAIEQAADPIELTDREAHLLYANRAWEATFGYPRTASLGKTVGSLFRDPTGPVHDAAFYQFTLATLAGGQAWTGALACRAQDGRRIFCEPMVSPFSAPEQGFSGNLAVRRELTQRMQRDQALAVAHHEFRAVLSAIPDAVAVLRDDAIYFANAALLTMVGRAEGDVIGCRYADFIHGEDRLQFLREYAEGTTRVRVVRTDGSIRFAEITTAGAVSFEGKPATILFARDTTDHQVAQEQLSRAEKLSALGSLAAGIAHEINNPLAYVLLNLGVAGEGGEALTGPQQAALCEAVEGAERIRQIVRELHAYSGQDRPGPPEAVSVAKAAASAINIAQNQIRHRAQLERTLPDDLYVLAREGQLVQVLVNLLVNAAQAIPNGSAQEARVRIEARRSPGDRVEILVSDTGEGIPAALLPRVFEAFTTSKRRGEGSGLGLVISKRIVEGFGGSIRIDSTPGAGTTVTVELTAAGSQPSVEEPPTSVVQRRSHAPSTGMQSGRVHVTQPCARVLVVDDEQALAKVIARMLYKHDVTTAHSAQEALAVVRESPPFDVVLCDLMMPAMPGPELYRLVCELQPRLTHRFVFMTGGAFTDVACEFLDRTSCPVLNKPFDLASLHAAVERVLEGEAERASG